MAYASLEEFVLRLERMGELRRIRYPADPRLEITEIADRVVKAGGPAPEGRFAELSLLEAGVPIG